MICPDWHGLVEHRFSRGGEEPEGWGDALDHLDRCRDCRRIALSVDPTLAFRKPRASSPPDVEAILQGVRTLRRNREQVQRPRPWHQALSAAALFTLALVSLPVAESPAPDLWTETAPLPFVENLPIVEAVDRPEARIYQLAGEDMSMVLIVDETLDV